MNDRKINIVVVVLLLGAISVAGAFINNAFQQRTKISAQEAEISKLREENCSLKEELKNIYENPEGFIYNYNMEKAQRTIENGSAEVPSPSDR